MTVTVQLSPNQSALLAREANRRGVAEEALATEWLARCLSDLAVERVESTGAKDIAFWEQQNIPECDYDHESERGGFPEPDR